jgi:hypothetical protein
VPLVLPPGWTNPNGIVLSGLTPQLIVPAPQPGATYTMNQLIAFASGTYPPTPQTTLYQINSNYTINGIPQVPQISPVNAVNVQINLVSGSYFNSNPQTIYSFSPSVPFGSQIQITPYQFVWLHCVDNQVNQIQVVLTDQNGNPLNNLDNQIIANFYFRRITGNNKNRNVKG